jgi:hypothetical protein
LGQNADLGLRIKHIDLKLLKNLLYILVFILAFQNCRPPEDKMTGDFSGKPKVPQVILTEHRSLLSFVDSLTLMKDSTGLVALKLKEVMMHHFEEEEDFVLPPLGALTLLARDSIPAKFEEIIQLSEKLKRQHNHMLAEHQLITAFLGELVRVSKNENHKGIETFQKKLLAHAETEETIHFPAAILAGEYLKLKTK